MLEKLQKMLGEAKVLVKEPMASHTTFRIGGPADYFVMPETVEELANVLGKIITKKPLREYGMKPEEARIFAESCWVGQQRLLNQSYVKFDVDVMEEIYAKLY